MRGTGYGPIVDIVIGIAGAIIGGWVMRAFGFRGQGGSVYTILVAIGGAIVLTWIYRRILVAEEISRADQIGTAVTATGQKRHKESHARSPKRTTFLTRIEFR